MGMSDERSALTGLTQDQYRRLCLRAFGNLPSDTPVTMDDVDAILCWVLPEYDDMKFPLITRDQQDGLAPILERAMAYNPDVADLIMAAYRLGRTHKEPAGYPFESELRPEKLDEMLPSGERRVFRGTYGKPPGDR